MEHGTQGKFNIDGLRLYLESKIDSLVELQKERSRHYEDKFRLLDIATEKALAAVKEQTSAAFAANKEAVIKTEDAQRAYNASHNDLARKMETQAKQFVDRDKLDDFVNLFTDKIDEVKRDIVALRQSDSASGGRREQYRESRQQSNWSIGQAITIALVLAGFFVGLIEFWLRIVIKP